MKNLEENFFSTNISTSHKEIESINRTDNNFSDGHSDEEGSSSSSSDSDSDNCSSSDDNYDKSFDSEIEGDGSSYSQVVCDEKVSENKLIVVNSDENNRLTDVHNVNGEKIDNENCDYVTGQNSNHIDEARVVELEDKSFGHELGAEILHNGVECRVIKNDADRNDVICKIDNIDIFNNCEQLEANLDGDDKSPIKINETIISNELVDVCHEIGEEIEIVDADISVNEEIEISNSNDAIINTIDAHNIEQISFADKDNSREENGFYLDRSDKIENLVVIKGPLENGIDKDNIYNPSSDNDANFTVIENYSTNDSQLSVPSDIDDDLQNSKENIEMIDNLNKVMPNEVDDQERKINTCDKNNVEEGAYCSKNNHAISFLNISTICAGTERQCKSNLINNKSRSFPNLMSWDNEQKQLLDLHVSNNFGRCRKYSLCENLINTVNGLFDIKHRTRRISSTSELSKYEQYNQPFNIWTDREIQEVDIRSLTPSVEIYTVNPNDVSLFSIYNFAC